MIDKIKAVLDATKYTTYFIAQECGVHQSQINKYRTGSYNIENMTLKTALALCEFYDRFIKN